MPNRSILLIDDNAAELKLCEIAMQNARLTHPVVSFSSPEAAFNHIAANAEDIFVIICDIKMPGMTGLDLLEKINSDKTLKLQSIPFVFLSNSDTPKDIVHAYSLAAQGYFIKPYKIDELETVFKSIINYWSISRIPPQSSLAA